MSELPVINLSVVRGSSNTFNISMNDPDGNVYVLDQKETLRFGVKKYPEDSKYRILKNLASADYKNGVYPVVLKPEDTQVLTFGTYYYDVGVQNGDDYYPIVAVSTFEVTKNVTRREDSGNG